MSGDYTRFTFDPSNGFSGVRKQQGRVSLDSDFNEFEGILDRRARAQTYDLVGRAVVPLTTPHGFEIGMDAGKLTIGPGRAYVDGILVECFGDTSSPVFDERLGGDRGSAPLAFESQPFFFPSNFPGISTTAGTLNLVYLDVWSREVTVFEDEGLREPALNGPDTTTRIQTAWQVKVWTEDVNAASCQSPPPKWTTLTAPSTARLTAQAAATLTEAAPCVINPVGGYTGLENRLYRVEVHQAGTLAGGGGASQATFKWSRDNASVVARVLGIKKGPPSESVLTVSSTGRDAWLRIVQGDHIELLDDSVEFALRDSNVGGRMARVLSVNDATGEIHVDADLSDFIVVPGRHARLKRWDTAGSTEELWRSVNNGTPIPIENGISVTFLGTGDDTLHAGDHWVFAARTADGSIDSLVNAPPRGDLHHYAQLAVVKSGNPASIGDCRTFWPPSVEGCCTVVVKPGGDIQSAIDSLPKAGGCVCLKTGVHEVTSPIRIARSRIILHGEGPGTVVRATGTSSATNTMGVLLLTIGHGATEASSDQKQMDLEFEVRVTDVVVKSIVST